VLLDNNRGKTEILGERLILALFCPPKISCGLPRDSKVSCLSYARPNNGKGEMSKYIFIHCPPIHCLKVPKLSPLIHLVMEVFGSR